MKKLVETLQKQIMDAIFNTKNSQLWLCPYRQKESFRYKAKIDLLQIYRLSIFVRSREKCHYQSHWIRNFWFFFPYFSSPSRNLNVTVCKWYGFFSVLVAIIRKNSGKRPWIEHGDSSILPSGAKSEWPVVSWVAISNTCQKISYFFKCVVTAFLRARNPCMTP